MAAIYDYVVRVRVTRKTGETEEYSHLMQAYGIQDAVLATIFEIDSLYDVTKGGGDVKILTIRPDAEKVAETNRALAAQATELAKTLGASLRRRT